MQPDSILGSALGSTFRSKTKAGLGKGRSQPAMQLQWRPQSIQQGHLELDEPSALSPSEGRWPGFLPSCRQTSAPVGITTRGGAAPDVEGSDQGGLQRPRRAAAVSHQWPMSAAAGGHVRGTEDSRTGIGAVSLCLLSSAHGALTAWGNSHCLRCWAVFQHSFISLWRAYQGARPGHQPWDVGMKLGT